MCDITIASENAAFGSKQVKYARRRKAVERL